MKELIVDTFQREVKAIYLNLKANVENYAQLEKEIKKLVDDIGKKNYGLAFFIKSELERLRQKDMSEMLVRGEKVDE